MDTNKIQRVEAIRELHKNAACCLEQIREAAPHKAVVVRPLVFHLTNQSSKMNDTSGALL